MRRYASHPKCVGIGEAGLDYHYNYAPPEVARRVFRGQIALARELGLPLVIHTREAEDDTAAILKDEMGQGAFAALLHCFTSSRALADTAIELGLTISFSGVVTFRNSAELARDRPRRSARPDPGRDRRALSCACSRTGASATSRHSSRRPRMPSRKQKELRRGAGGGDLRQYAQALPETRPGGART